jgi:hypothetical protein
MIQTSPDKRRLYLYEKVKVKNAEEKKDNLSSRRLSQDLFSQHGLI